MELSATEILTISGAVVLLTELIKFGGIPDKWGLLVAALTSVLGVAAYMASKPDLVLSRLVIWPLFTATVTTLATAAGVFGFVRQSRASDVTTMGGTKAATLLLMGVLGGSLLFAGCALKGSARHAAVIADTTIHASLASLQDAEMAMFRAGVPEVVANHQRFNQQLLPALETGDAINRTIRAWPVDQPAPADLPLLASRLQGLTRTIAANFSEGEAKSRLLTRVFAVSDVVLNLLLTLPPAQGAAPMLAPAH